ncbi:uncharacterized protein YALI1_D05736g [Yarrowia lipolytica]|uniref:Uncharacterized protein n=1 Tax=Yarrowia lipolytica TaxID=4952 RepID=A0A1D8ND74_YARLL|nr:hypothetical protein YALI1_D05736g [Yarrowia lipolytica]
MKFTALAIAAFAAVAVAQDDGGLDALKSQYPQYFSGVTSLSVPAQYQTAVVPSSPSSPPPGSQQSQALLPALAPQQAFSGPRPLLLLSSSPPRLPAPAPRLLLLPREATMVATSSPPTSPPC